MSGSRAKKSKTKAAATPPAATPAKPVSARYVKKNLDDYRQYARYIQSKLPMALQAQVQNTAEINQLLEAKKRVSRHLQRYKDKYAADLRIQKALDELKATATKPVADKSYSFSQERKIITAATPEALQQDVIKQAKEFLGKQGDIIASSVLRSGKSMVADAALRDSFVDKDNTAAVDLVIAGDNRLINVIRKRDNSYVCEFYNLEQFSAPGIGAMFDRFRSADTSTLKWAITTVENFLINSPFPDDTIVIMGSMPHKCVEAIMLYCKFKGYACINQTTAKVDITDKKLNAFREKMLTKYQALVGMHTALALEKSAVEEMENVTKGLKV